MLWTKKKITAIFAITTTTTAATATTTTTTTTTATAAAAAAVAAAIATATTTATPLIYVSLSLDFLRILPNPDRRVSSTVNRGKRFTKTKNKILRQKLQFI